MTEDEDNHFTKNDIKDAFKALKADKRLISTLASRAWIEKSTKVTIPPNKRNGRKQKQHCEVMRAIQGIVNPNWRDGNGRPDKKKIVHEWQRQHPDGRKVDCIRDTGLSKPTVLKWWESSEK